MWVQLSSGRNKDILEGIKVFSPLAKGGILTVNTRFILSLIIVATIALSGCMPGTIPEIAIITPTSSPPPVMDDATLLSIALDDISGDQDQYSIEDRNHPNTDKNLMEELNKLLTNRAYKEVFDTKFEVINVTWLTPSNDPNKVDVLLMINCNGRQDDDCTIQKTTSETIFILRWVPAGSGSSVHPWNTTIDGRYWAFPTNTRSIYFYTYDTKIPEGCIKGSGEHVNEYINGLLSGESLSTLLHVEVFP